MSWEHLCIYLSLSWVGLCPLKARSVFCPEGVERGTWSLQSHGGRQRVVLSDLSGSWAFPYIRGASWVSVNSFSFPGSPCVMCVQGRCSCFAGPCAGGLCMCCPSPAALGGVCGCCSPCSAPTPSSVCVSPVNQTLPALGSTVTTGAELCTPAPLSPAPFAFLVSTSLPILSKGKKQTKLPANHPFLGGTH